MPLTEVERDAVSRRVAEVEARTGAQVVAALVDRSDAYPELPWKAFALAASVGALVAVVAVALHPALGPTGAALRVATAALGAGAALALAAAFLRPVGRAMLDAHRAEAEVRQHARELFLRHELFRTRRRAAVLMLVSEFERRVVVLPDVGLQAAAPPERLQGVVAAMTAPLAAGRPAEAFAAGLATLEALLASAGAVGDGSNEIAEALIEEREP